MSILKLTFFTLHSAAFHVTVQYILHPSNLEKPLLGLEKVGKYGTS